MYLIKQAAKLSGVSVRTLHHYDRIGLLVPRKAANGYRYYDEENLNVLQQICFYKYLGFSLQDIRRLLTQPPRENLAVLREQRALLEKEKQRLMTLIRTIEQSIAALQGETTMTAQEKFAGFSYDDYLVHAEEKYDCCLEDILAKQKGQEKRMMEEFNALFFRFARHRQAQLPAAGREAQETTRQLHEFLKKYTCDEPCTCTLNMFAEMGELYVDNQSFQTGLDQFGEGTAQYARDAIRHYVGAQT
ncbi:MerR family transcriptional regulator [Vandammella animalimorsus]|uniref:MerR family transcriptional regulator n=1 Tax=Vandammella animalimorsus TaxID=2029117 RepID=A0A3M6RI50_9BURK|nr:MerR family transcriptional regulator [Vandammella animalimorsus]RMX14830.1 MerR family transcriptional regulator [Vandammella animalimorsus]